MKFLAVASLFAVTAYAAINGRCSVNGTPGVCLPTASCSRGGGKSTPGFCLSDPTDVQCCTKTSCGNGGSCKWTDQCSGTPVANLCPGPNDFKCCQGGGGTPSPPKIPTYNCKQHVIDAGYVILQQFPGKVLTVYCYANKAGDHGKGLALDLMIQNRNPIGEVMAEWTMNHAASLNVNYVIWGQRIWQASVDKIPKPWSQWKKMEDRGNDTANHWDHNHVSFNAVAGLKAQDRQL